MSTITGTNETVNLPQNKSIPSGGRLARRIGTFLLKALLAIVVTLSVVPVILLPLATSVPWYAWLSLALIDAALIHFLVARAESAISVLGALAAIVLVSTIAVFMSQWFAATPPIRDADGRPIPGSIAELEKVELNGSEQWVSIRGRDQTKPVLLFLAGGPGGSQLAATRKHLAALEEHFVVVNWEQPGVGKSFGAVDIASLTPERYVEDGLALSHYLRQRFGQEKIYLMGESWGSFLGVWMAQREPESYHAMVGVAQMVDLLETDIHCYKLALQLAFEQGDFDKVTSLIVQGPPPYNGPGVARKAAAYLMPLTSHMAQNPNITGPGYDTIGDIAAPEYGLYDKVNYARGLLATMDVVYPQLWDVDLREEASRLETPVYFLEGRHDVNAPPALVESYYQVLDAPHKEIIWFEHSGHSPWIDEADKVVDVLVNTVLAGAGR